jgi:ribokinase
MTSDRFEVVVVGSLNVDRVCRVDELPRPGETVLGGEASVFCGGKGGNQAVAASLLGARTAMVGRTGTDEDGRVLVAALRDAGVDVSEVRPTTDAPTGTAFVLVAADGENAIVVAPGANARLEADEVRAAVQAVLAPGGVLVTQAEIPPSCMEAAVTAAVELGALPVVNLAPYRPAPDELLAHCDPLVVNESEAARLLGVETGTVSGEEACRRLSGRTRSALVTLGAAGAALGVDGTVEVVAAEPARVVDTTGAGDAFVGATAAALSRGAALLDAVRQGVRAGTYAVGRAGAQASYPTSGEISP